MACALAHGWERALLQRIPAPHPYCTVPPFVETEVHGSNEHRKALPGLLAKGNSSAAAGLSAGKAMTVHVARPLHASATDAAPSDVHHPGPKLEHWAMSEEPAQERAGSRRWVAKVSNRGCFGGKQSPCVPLCFKFRQQGPLYKGSRHGLGVGGTALGGNSGPGHSP